MSEDAKVDLSQLSTLLGDFSHLASRIRHISIDPNIGPNIAGRGSYVALRDGSPTIKDFVATFAHHLAAYALPRSQIIEASVEAGGDPTKQLVWMTRLREEAAAMFIKAQKGTSRSGEFGEIVLYILIEWLLEAPQIVSKMFLKTAFQMPVYGTDGIHARLENDGKLSLIWGESKAHTTLQSALSDALKSIEKFIEKEEEDSEVKLVSGHLDIGNLSNSFRSEILKYLNPYKEESNNRVNRFAILLMYNFEYGQDGKCSDDFIVDQFAKQWPPFCSSVTKKSGASSLSGKAFDFFLLPVPDVQDVRDRFQAIIGM